MKISVYVRSKKIRPFFLRAINEYEKRLVPFCKTHFETYTGCCPASAPSGSIVIVVSPGVDTVSSEGFADMLAGYSLSGKTSVTFVIGGYPDPDRMLSISSVDTGPEMLAVLLFEQIYRSYCINSGHPYHK